MIKQIGCVKEDVVPYLRQADTSFHNGFETEELRQIFLHNVFEEISGRELKLIQMKSTSYILEKFVAAASTKNLLQLLKVSRFLVIHILCGYYIY